MSVYVSDLEEVTWVFVASQSKFDFGLQHFVDIEFEQLSLCVFLGHMLDDVAALLVLVAAENAEEPCVSTLGCPGDSVIRIREAFVRVILAMRAMPFHGCFGEMLAAIRALNIKLRILKQLVFVSSQGIYVQDPARLLYATIGFLETTKQVGDELLRDWLSIIKNRQLTRPSCFCF